jgi:hypothetical protein
VQEVALALSENLPAPKAQPNRNRRRRKRKKPGAEGAATQNGTPAAADGATPDSPAKKRRRRRKKPAAAGVDGASPKTDATPDAPKVEAG